MFLRELCVLMLQLDEGWRSRPYYCSNRYPTVGFGFKIGDKGDPLPDLTLDRSQGQAQLQSLIGDAIQTLATHRSTKDTFSALKVERQAVLVSMYYQLGFAGLLRFKRMWLALDAHNYAEAAVQIRDSAAWRDPHTRERFQRNSDMMESGGVDPHYLKGAKYV